MAFPCFCVGERSYFKTGGPMTETFITLGDVYCAASASEKFENEDKVTFSEIRVDIAF